jgi:hypothetical protein
MSPICPGVLATKLVVEKPVRRATRPVSATNEALVGQRCGPVSPSMASRPNWHRAPSRQSAANAEGLRNRNPSLHNFGASE